MTPTRDEFITFLTDEIMDGTLKDKRVCLASVLDDMLVQQNPLLDTDELAELICGDENRRQDIIDRAQKYARRIVMDWLTKDKAGSVFVDRQMEKAKEEAEEETE
jgi:hypothetical protein